MKKLLFCTQKVNRKHIRREIRDSVEHIILTSFTLPPNIVMNGGLYPAEEIDKSFETLNRTPVTIEHPEIDGMFVSASDPETDMVFRFGMFNENARKLDDGRIALDKVINVQKLMTFEKGKRLLDRINEIETNDNARPIHTSVGVFLDVEELPEARNEVNGVETNAEFTWIAKDMIFDHDAILLDSVGASTPDQGTGIGINKERLKVEHFVVDNGDEYSIPKDFIEKSKSLHSNKKITFAQIFEELHRLINQNNQDDEHNWLVHESVDEDSFVFETISGELFKSNYSVDDNGNVAIQDTRIPVERVVEFKTINPTDINEDNAMRDQIIAELAKLGITVNADLSDDELMAKYNEALIANQGDGDGAGGEEIADLVANAVKVAIKPLTEKITGLETQLTSNEDKELVDLATLIVNSKKYPELDVDNIKALGLEVAKKMAANCGVSHGIGSTTQVNNQDSDAFKTNVEDLPE